MAAPDTGGTKRANAYAKHLGVDMAICYKQRKVANQVESMTVIGDVAGKNVILVDDMVDTGGTLTKAATMMMEQGAQRACHVHPCRAQRRRLRARPEQRPPGAHRHRYHSRGAREARRPPKIKQLSVARLFADVIQRVRHHESISSHFIIA
jgi:ribose-phosphate pyrophosphokinase